MLEARDEIAGELQLIDESMRSCAPSETLEDLIERKRREQGILFKSAERSTRPPVRTYFASPWIDVVGKPIPGAIDAW